MLVSKGYLLGLKYVDLDLYESYVWGKQKQVSFVKAGRESEVE